MCYTRGCRLKKFSYTPEFDAKIPTGIPIRAHINSRKFEKIREFHGNSRILVHPLEEVDNPSENIYLATFAVDDTGT